MRVQAFRAVQAEYFAHDKIRAGKKTVKFQKEGMKRMSNCNVYIESREQDAGRTRGMDGPSKVISRGKMSPTAAESIREILD